MDEPVAVVTPFPALRRGLTSMLADTAFSPVEPDDPDAWVGMSGHRVVLMAVARIHDIRLVVDLRRAEGDLAVVVLLPELSPEIVREAILAGVCSVACWDASPEEVVAMLEAGLESRSILPTPMLLKLAKSTKVAAQPVDIDREQIEWLRALAKGETVNHLAERIAYSEREVYRLLRALYNRLGVDNRTEALIWATQQGIVE